MLIPGTGFNKGRNKLFFFFSQDILQRTDPGGLNQRRMPTALERKGDFSQTFDAAGQAVFIRDPLLPGNCSSTSGRTGVLPRQRHPGRPLRRGRVRAAEPVPAAECDRPDRRPPVQLRLPDRAGLAAQRPGAAHGLERRAARRPRTAGCSGDTKSAPAACRSSARRAPGGRSSRASTRSTPSATSTRCCTRSTRRPSPNSRSA